MVDIIWSGVVPVSRTGWIELPYPIKMGSQGRLTIPYEVRTSMKLTHGSKVYIALITEKDYEVSKRSG